MSSVDHPIGQEELMAYLDGELDLGRAGVAAKHLETCRDCQDVAADFESVSRRMMDWQVESAGERIRLDAVTALPIPPPERPGFRKRWLTPRLALGLGGASVAFLVLISLPPITHRREMQMSERAAVTLAPRGVAFEVATVPKIARTAQLMLTTSDFDKARVNLEEILKRYNGFVGELNVNSSAGSGRTLDATLQIPADRRDAAIADIKKLGRVESESQTGEDVTAQSIDLDIRLANARNTEQRLTAILHERTGKLSDVLEVEKEISRVRGEIEQMEAESKRLANRVSFLSLTVRISENYRAQAGLESDSIGSKLRNAAIHGYRSLAENVVGLALFLLAYGPSILLWGAVLFFPARFAWKRWRRS